MLAVARSSYQLIALPLNSLHTRYHEHSSDSLSTRHIVLLPVLSSVQDLILIPHFLLTVARELYSSWYIVYFI